MTRNKRILYVQYTNPGAYPPLEHSSRILADAGWRVQFLGTGALGASALRFPPHPNIGVRLWRFQPPGWKQKLHYLAFVAWCLAWCMAWRPKVLYCSDFWSAPIGVLAWYLFRVPVMYHEHDAPGPPTNSILRFVDTMRRRLARVAVACVIPQKERLARFVESLSPRRAICVWNCPRLDEVASPRPPQPVDRLRVLYHGSIVPERVPESFIQALVACPKAVSLTVIGYETVGAKGYSQRLVALSHEMNCSDRFHLFPAVPRFKLWQDVREHDVGCAFVPVCSSDPNLSSMIGASNKVFDYLACGLALTVSRLADWEAEYRAYGQAADPNNAQELAAVWTSFLEQPRKTQCFGEAGRRRILADWNYEAQFEPVKQVLDAL